MNCGLLLLPEASATTSYISARYSPRVILFSALTSNNGLSTLKHVMHQALPGFCLVLCPRGDTHLPPTISMLLLQAEDLRVQPYMNVKSSGSGYWFSYANYSHCGHHCLPHRSIHPALMLFLPIPIQFS